MVNLEAVFAQAAYKRSSATLARNYQLGLLTTGLLADSLYHISQIRGCSHFVFLPCTPCVDLLSLRAALAPSCSSLAAFDEDRVFGLLAAGADLGGGSRGRGQATSYAFGQAQCDHAGAPPGEMRDQDKICNVW